MKVLAEIVVLVLGLGLIAANLALVAYRIGVKDGFKEGYAKGRREIDTWWVEMDNQLEEEWLKIWREER
jgi:hypothetical protein